MYEESEDACGNCHPLWKPSVGDWYELGTVVGPTGQRHASVGNDVSEASHGIQSVRSDSGDFVVKPMKTDYVNSILGWVKMTSLKRAELLSMDRSEVIRRVQELFPGSKIEILEDGRISID
jgi:hypothetical protein